MDQTKILVNLNKRETEYLKYIKTQQGLRKNTDTVRMAIKFYAEYLGYIERRVMYPGLNRGD